MEQRGMILTRFDSAASAAAALAEEVIGALQQGLAARGAGSLALAGGRTPLPLFHALRDADLDWSRVGITLTDERWVAESDAASNAALLRTTLLGGRAAAARFFPLHDGSPDATAAAGAVWQRLQALPRPFDAVVLGMGEDGHFASLFPGNPGLSAALDPLSAPSCVAMQAPTAPAERLSLNLAALMQTRRLFLLVSGRVKEQLLLSAARREAGGEWPVSALLVQRQPLPEVFWSP
jgi:6-phosphogluconolactonase